MKATPNDKALLIVEDSPEDYEATARSFKKASVRNRLVHCEDGDEALDFLYRRNTWLGTERPCLVLLDLNLPGTDGREVLSTMKSDPELRTIPVIVLTTSTDERDIAACYESGANSYVRKPVGLQKFMDAMTKLTDYWLEISVLPRADG